MNNPLMVKIANDAYAQGVWATIDSLNLPNMIKEAALELLLKEAARADRQLAELAKEVKKSYPNATDAYIRDMVKGKSPKEINTIKKTFSAAGNPNNKTFYRAPAKLKKLLGTEALAGLERGASAAKAPAAEVAKAPAKVKGTASPAASISSPLPTGPKTPLMLGVDPAVSTPGNTPKVTMGPVVEPSVGKVTMGPVVEPSVGKVVPPKAAATAEAATHLPAVKPSTSLVGEAAQKTRGLSGRAKLLAGLGILGTGAAAAYGLSGEEEDEGLSNAEMAALGLGGTAALGGGLYAAGAFDSSNPKRKRSRR